MADQRKWEDEIEVATSFLAKNLVITRKLDEKGKCAQSSLLAGKIISNKKWGWGAKRVFEVFAGVWRCKRDWFVKEIRPGIMQFQFESQEDANRVLGGRPWTFKGFLMVIVAWPALKTIEELDFSFSPFWIRLRGLPPGFLNEASAESVAPMFGRYLGYGGREENDMRLKVNVDVRKQVFPGFFLDREEMRPLWIQGRYEKLGKLCFQCGWLGHDEGECTKNDRAKVRVAHSPEVNAYGGWIHAESAFDSCYIGLEFLIGMGKHRVAVAWLANIDNGGFFTDKMKTQLLKAGGDFVPESIPPGFEARNPETNSLSLEPLVDMKDKDKGLTLTGEKNRGDVESGKNLGPPTGHMSWDMVVVAGISAQGASSGESEAQKVSEEVCLRKVRDMGFNENKLLWPRITIGPDGLQEMSVGPDGFLVEGDFILPYKKWEKKVEAELGSGGKKNRAKNLDMAEKREENNCVLNAKRKKPVYDDENGSVKQAKQNTVESEVHRETKVNKEVGVKELAINLANAFTPGVSAGPNVGRGRKVVVPKRKISSKSKGQTEKSGVEKVGDVPITIISSNMAEEAGLNNPLPRQC